MSLIQVSFKNGFFVLELLLETVFKYIKDSQEDFKWPKVFLMEYSENTTTPLVYRFFNQGFWIYQAGTTLFGQS